MLLTDRQQAVLDFIQEYRVRQGVIPSLREIQTHFKFASPNGANRHILALEKKGVLQRSGGAARSLSITGNAYLNNGGIPAIGHRPESSILSASQINDLHFDWKRYWLPLEVEIQANWGKPIFFPDPEDDFGRYYNPLAAILPDLADHRLLVLCGEPASGKTTTINQYFKTSDPDVLLVRFQDVIGADDFKGRCFGNKKWKALAQGRRHLRLIIESLDEGRVQFPNLFDRILSEIEALDQVAKSKLKLVLTCRSFDWELLRGREAELKRALDLSGEEMSVAKKDGRSEPKAKTRLDYYVWKLCPLRQVDVEKAATTVLKGGHQDFIESIFKRGMQGFTAWPHTLKMVLREFASGTFAAKTRRQLYESYALELCRYNRLSDPLQEDWDSTVEDRFLVTKQLASLLVCTGKKYICLDHGRMDESDIDIRQITAGCQRGLGDRLLSEADVRAALRTANFSKYGAVRFGFNQVAHQECLAASFLGDLPRIQLRPLFFRTDFQGKHVIPALTHTASWIAEHHESFRADLMECNPTTLLRSDVTDLPDECKLILIDKMIELAEAREFVNTGKFFFEGLRHAGIVEQFRFYLRKPDIGDAARELLFDIIRQVAPLEMKDELLAMCKNDWRGDRYYLLASLALIAIATRSGTDALVELLNDVEFLAHDKNLNVRGRLLQKLVPSRIPPREAFQWIGPNGRFEEGPAYHIFIDTYLPAAMTEKDIPAALTFFKELKRWPTGSSAKASFAEKLIHMALDHLHNPEIAALLAAEWLKKHDGEYGHPFGDMQKIHERLAEDTSLRRSLARLLVETMKEVDCEGRQPFDIIWSTVLVSDDLLWILRQANQSTGGIQARWARMFAGNFNWSSSSMAFFKAHHQEIFGVIAHASALEEALAPVFAPIALDSETAQIQKKHHRDRAELTTKLRRTRGQQPWDKVVRRYLREIATKPAYWIALADTLRFDPSWKHGQPENDDDDRLIGLRFLDQEQREIVLEGARQFLLTKEPTENLSPLITSNYDDAAGPAAELLLEELETRPDLVEAISQKWIPSIIWHGFMNRADDKRRVVGVLYRMSPDVVVETLRRDIESAVEKDEGLVMLRYHGFEDCFDDRLFAVTKQFLRCAVRANSVSEIGEWLAEHQRRYFLRLLEEVMADPTSFSETVRFSLLAVGIKQLPRETWPQFAKYVFAEDTGKGVIWAAASIDLVRRARAFDGVVESDLGRLFERVAELYPPEEDPPHKSGFQEPYSRRRVAEFRALIVQELTDRATIESVNELLRLRRQVPASADVLLWKVHQATENLRMKSWNPPEVESLAQVILSPDTCRLAETAEALLDVVIESLERLQNRISESSNPRILDFWRIGVGGPRTNRENRGPVYEEDISWRLAAWFQDDLRLWFPALVGREVQPRWNERTDITVDAPLRQGDWKTPSHPRVVIEVKGAWHEKVETAAKTQLVDTYLLHQAGVAGLYVVCWFGASFQDEGSRRNCLAASNIREAREHVNHIIAKTQGDRPGFLLKGFVLDLSLNTEAEITSGKQP